MAYTEAVDSAPEALACGDTHDQKSARKSSYENRMVLILATAGGVAALDAQAVFYLMPFIAAEFGLTSGQIGIIGSAVLIGWALGGMVIARLSDRSGQRKPYLIGAFACFGVLSGLSAATRSFTSLLLARLLMGIAEGPVIPVKQAMVIAESSPNRRGLNMGIVQNFGAQFLGTLVGPLLLVAMAQHFGWRAAFFIAGVPGLIVAALVWKFLREPAKLAPSASPSSGADPAWRRLIKSHNVLVSMMISLLSVAWFFIMLTFLPLYLTRELHYSPSGMSVLMSLIGLAGVTSAVIVPRLSDLKGRRFSILSFSVVGAIAPLGVLLSGTNPWLSGIALLLGCQMLGTFPLLMATVPQESVAPQDRATATSLVIAVAQLGGGVIGPMAGGWLAERAGGIAPLFLAGGLALIAACLTPLICETHAGFERKLEGQN